MRESSCFGAHARDKLAGVGGRLFLCGVIRLAKFIREGFHQVGALTHENMRGALFKRHRDERSPSRMGAKAKGGMLHTTSRQDEANITNPRDLVNDRRDGVDR